MTECQYFKINQHILKLQDQLLLYQGSHKKYYGKVGKLIINFDENCCAPTQEQRYTFEGDDFFLMMSLEEIERELPFFLPISS